MGGIADCGLGNHPCSNVSVVSEAAYESCQNCLSPDLSLALHDCPELAGVVIAWRHLPEHIRAAILSLVQVPR